MSEVKGTLLTIILALSVFGIVFGVIVGAIQEKTNDVVDQISEAGETTKSAPKKTNTLTYTY